MLILMNTWTVLKDLMKKNCLLKKCFQRSVKDGTTGDNGERLDGLISDKDYLRRNKIWNELYIKNMGDYHDRCLKKEVLLLADIFEKFIDMCLKFDPCNYFSSPELSWDAMLKMIGMKSEKISDIDMCLFLEKD